MAQGKRHRAEKITEHLGVRLRWAREAENKTQADMCRLLDDMDPSTWNRWEHGSRYPDPVVMVRLCERFGLTMDYLYRGKLAGVREDMALRLAARHPELVEDQLPAVARRVGARERAA